jgi:hypothetical protein
MEIRKFFITKIITGHNRQIPGRKINSQLTKYTLKAVFDNGVFLYWNNSEGLLKLNTYYEITNL